MRVYILLTMAVWSATVATAVAQSGPSPLIGEPLSLSDAVQEARQRHPSLMAARDDAAALGQRPAVERTLRPPMLDARIWQWPVTTLNPADVDMFMFMVQQEIPGRGKRALRAEAAEREADRGWAAAESLEWQVVTEVKQAYAALRAVRCELAATVAEEAILDDLLGASELAYASGRGTQAAVIRVGLERSELEERLVTLRFEEERARAALNGSMGRSASVPIGPLDASPPPVALPPLETLVALAGDRHPALDERRADVLQAEAAIRAARAEARPDWLVEGGYMLMPGEAGAWGARVGISWPNAPWSRTRVTAATTEAQARRRAAAARVEAERLALEQAVAERLSLVRGLQRRLVVVRTSTRPQAQHLGDATELAFAAGSGDLADVLDARSGALAVDVELARLTGALDQAWATLEAVVGVKLTPEVLATARTAAADIPVTPLPAAPAPRFPQPGDLPFPLTRLVEEIVQ